MVLVMLLAGIMLVYSGIANKTDELQKLLKESVGFKQFWAFAIAILLVGALGRAASMKPISDALIGLIVLVLILSERGAFAKLTQLVNSGGSVGLPDLGSASEITQ